MIREARRLSTAERRVLQVSDFQLGFADICFRAIQLLLDDGDARPRWDRLTDLGRRAAELCDSVDWGEVEFADDMDLKSLGLAWRKLEEHLEIEVDRDGEVILPRWFRRLPVPEFRRFVQKYLGASRVDRLARGFRQDGATLGIAVRRCLRHALPLAAAFDRCARVLTPDQLAEIEGAEHLARSSILELFVQLDSLVSRIESDGVRFNAGLARPSELSGLPRSCTEIARLTNPAISDNCTTILEDLSASLARKITGARDALDNSADGVSQAAHSIVELIDRMLRIAFEPAAVLEWIDRHRSMHQRQLIYQEHGQTLPTKAATALCFVCAGNAPSDPSMIEEVVAKSIVVSRNRLQSLKHADAGSSDEREQVTELLEAVEGSLVRITRVTWPSAKEPALVDIRERLSLAA
ncbi:MAG: hypothetical protein OXG69_07945 [bacterium]|nr:hypothetical protein [bacterium]